MSKSSRLTALATRLAALQTSPPNETALLGFLTGAIYALKRAYDLGYDNARAQGSPQDFDDEAHRVLIAISKTDPVDSEWLAGYYLNDALMRLAALNDRIDKHRGVKQDLAKKIRRAVNRLKHDVDPHLSRGLQVNFEQVLRAAEDLTQALEFHISRRGSPSNKR